MHISNNILRHYLKNVLFLTGTAYAGKSTMVRMLAERYGLLACGENYHMAVSDQIADVRCQPNTCYFQTMSGWQEFLNRTPEEYERWILDGNREIAEFEVAELIRLSASGKKIIVDTNIPLDLLREIADYHQVAVMLSPQSMSVGRFFDREDPEKQFLLRQIDLSDDPQKTMENFKNCIARVNSQAHYREYESSGFFTLVRQDSDADTREETLRKLADHFRLDGSGEENAMIEYAPDDIALAVASLSSTIRKLEKALATLSRKEKPNAGQIRMVENGLKNHRLMLALIQGEGQLSEEELEDLSKVIHRYVEKIEAILPKFAPGTSQHTLAVRRIAAYEMALALAERK